MNRPVITLADYCEGLGMPRSAMVDLIKIINANERAEMASIKARRERGNPKLKARPLRLGKSERGRCVADIPAAVFHRLIKQKDFGWAGMNSREGRRDLLKAFPECAVETVSGKCQVGYTGENRKIIRKY